MSDKYLDLLANVPLFENFSKKDLQKVAQAVDQIDVDEGRVLMREGETSHEAFVVMSGQVEVSHDGEALATLEAGAPFGEMGLVDKAPRNATVTATEPSTLLVIGQRQFSGLLSDSPDFAHTILEALANRLREANPQLF